MLIAFEGEDLPLDLSLEDYATDRVAKARVYEDGSLLTTLTLPHVTDGYYRTLWPTTSSGRFYIAYDVYLTDGVTLAGYSVADVSILVLAGRLATTGVQVKQSYTLDETSNSIIVNVWLELDGVQITSDVVDATLVLYNATMGVIATPATQTTPQGLGVFRFVISPIPGFALGETATVSRATIDYTGDPAKTYSSVTGVTFSRSA